MLIKITPKNIQRILTEHGLAPAEKLSTLVLTLIDNASRDGDDEIKIFISFELLPRSYKVVPAMFGRQLSNQSSFYSISSTRALNPNYLLLYAGDEKYPGTFKARVIRGLSKYGKFQIKKSAVPVSYRNNPIALARVIAAEISIPVRLDKPSKDGFLRWVI